MESISPTYNNPIQMETDHPEVTVDVIIPARNEEDCIARCLQSLVDQQGIAFQITVIDDGSTDHTRAIAESFQGVQVLGATEPKPGVMGKCNALIIGAAGAKAQWLLFTDADTVHYPGSLAAAVAEAENRQVDLLSYSPEQEVATWWELAVMPVVFAELARTYPPSRVNDPADPTVAANGQYVLVRRRVYEALAGHSSVACNMLEDVELARIFKASNHKIWFRFGSGMVRTRMYRSFRAMWDGWTKNLSLLFRHTLALAALRGFEFLVIAGSLAAGIALILLGDGRNAFFSLVFATLAYLNFISRIQQAHFPWKANFMAFIGLPIFVSLLVRSHIHSNIRGELTWKGRTYSQSAPKAAADSSIRKGDLS
ncbi:MAG TPA: glycosyltransferase family 2 protein [Candidatus Binatia bacterium]|nr:glycosyltransferase family 2 protein [Candidatus Binatia bacterium]